MHLKKLGRYDLVRVLGKGAMGVVYEGRDPNLDRQVAIKTIMVDGLGTAAAAEYEERFRTEARSAARLQHPNIVTVYDSDRDGDTAFLVMEFVAGDDLKQLLDGGGRYATADALHLIHDLLAALDFAHRQGVVHRDIKPANLLVEKGGRLKLTDFGVARIAGEATRTQGSMIGTLKYMAPEQVQGQKVDARADLFSAAVVTYQLLTGARPFDGDNDFSIIHQVISHTPAAPTSLAPELPPAVDAVMARAMAKDRDQRFATAADFWQALREAFPTLDLPVLPVPQAATRVPAAPAGGTITSPPSSRSPTIPGTAITQELELEYWRAVRDATDPRELEGFLARFPEGIYADLARRRLQRLERPDDPDQTVLRGLTKPPSAAPAGESSGSFPSTLPLTSNRPSEPQPAEQAWQELAQAHAPRAPVAAAVVPSTARDEGSTPLPPLPRAPALRWTGAAAAVAAVAFVAVLVWSRSPGPAAGSATAAMTDAPAAASAAPTAPPSTPSSPAAAPAPQPGVTSSLAATKPAASPDPAVRPVAAAAPARASTPANAPRKPAAGAAPGPAPGSTASPAPASSNSSELQPRTEEPPAVAQAAPAPARAPRLVPPSETCKDRFFLAREFCLQTECAKPGYQNFSACVKLREEARLRDESRVRN